MTDKNRAILVLGSHRSGTSALTRVINLLGADLGSRLLPSKFDNPYGYWEHYSIFALHERLLSLVGSAWHDYRPLPEDWQQSPGVAAVREEILEVLGREFGQQRLWAVKDPRLNRLLPMWSKILDEMHVAPSFLILIRNPLEIVASLEKRDGFSRSKCFLLTLTDTLAALRYSAGYPRAFVSYPGLLGGWQSTVDFIAQKLELEWPRTPAEAAGEIDAFLRPSERHNRNSMEELRQAAEIPPWVVSLFEALEAASQGDETGLAEAVDHAEAHLAGGFTLFGPEVDGQAMEGARWREQAELLEKERNRLQQRARYWQGELNKTQEHLLMLLSHPLFRYTRGLRRGWRFFTQGNQG